MVRDTVRIAMIALATLAAQAVFFAVPPTASASTGDTLCEASGSYCLGAPNLNLDTRLDEAVNGRNLVETPLGGTFAGYSTYLLQFASDPSECVASSNSDFYVVIHVCNGGSGIVWAKDTSTSHIRWINQYATDNCGCGGKLNYLVGENIKGNYFNITVGLGGYALYYEFNWS
jgi:hypothetical protein